MSLSGCEEINAGKESPLDMAIRSNDIKRVEILIGKGTDVDAVNKCMDTPNWTQFDLEEKEIEKYLLSNNGDESWGKIERRNTPLLIAVSLGNEEIVKLLLDKAADVNVTGERRRTVLHNAVNNKQDEDVIFLLNYSAEIREQINLKDLCGGTPLYLASQNECESIVNILLDYNAEIRCEGTISPLICSAAKGNKAITKLLLEKGAAVNVEEERGPSVLHNAVPGKNEKVIKLLLDYSALVRDDINFKNYWNETLLYCAAKDGCENIVKVLLDHDAEINGEGAESPLMVAALTGNESITKLLVDNGADVNVRDEYGRTVLHQATIGNNEKVVKLILDYNAEVRDQINFKDNFNKTSLYCAAVNGCRNIIKILLEYDAEINCRGAESPLVGAIYSGSKSITKLLLDKGAYVNVKDKDGLTVLHEAVNINNEKMVKLLLEYVPNKYGQAKEVDVNLEDNLGKTPLFYASERPYVNKNIFKLLLEYDADPNYKSKQEFTPFQFAVVKKYVKTVAIFLDYVDINMIFNKDIKYPNYFDFSSNPNYFGFSLSKKMEIIIDTHIIKLKVAGLYLNNHLRALSSIYEALDFHKECEEEVERMKLKINDTTVSLHDVLVSRIDNCVYSSNKYIALAFESKKYKGDFPIYASMIERQYEKGVRRQKLQEETRFAFNVLTSPLPDVCLYKINYYLTNNDLKKLKFALKLSNYSKHSRT